MIYLNMLIKLFIKVFIFLLNCFFVWVRSCWFCKLNNVVENLNNLIKYIDLRVNILIIIYDFWYNNWF